MKSKKSLKEKKSSNSDYLKKGIFAVVIFVFGLVIGATFKIGDITKLEGYLLNAIGFATAGDATYSDATYSDATYSDATYSDATYSDATSSNAWVNDNYLYLNRFAFSSTNVNAGSQAYITVDTSGADLSGGSVILENTTTGATFSSNINNIRSNPYITIPNTTTSGTYKVTNVLLTGVNSDYSTFTRQFNSTSSGTDVRYYNFANVTINVKANEGTVNPELSELKLSSSSYSKGDKVQLSFKSNVKLSNMSLVFTSGSDKIEVNVNSLYNNPYFEIPTSAVAGNYSLSEISLTANSKNVKYTTGSTVGAEKTNITASFTVSNNVSTYVYKSSELDDATIKEIYNLTDGANIKINSYGNPIISSELFNAIKGRNKTLTIDYEDSQIIFNGNTVNNPKTIDSSITINNISENENIKKLISKGIAVTFASNGELPGKATVQIKSTDDTNQVLSGSKIYAYYFNESRNTFCLISDNVKKVDGQYVFDITHTSTYVLTDYEIDKSIVENRTDYEDDNIVNFRKSNGLLVLLIVFGVIVIAVVVGIIVYLKVFKKKKNNTESKYVDLDKDIPSINLNNNSADNTNNIDNNNDNNNNVI